MTGLEPAIPRSEVWCLIHLATWSHLMSRSVLNDNFNRKHGEILDTAQGLEDSIRLNLFQSDLIVKGKHGEMQLRI